MLHCWLRRRCVLIKPIGRCDVIKYHPTDLRILSASRANFTTSTFFVFDSYHGVKFSFELGREVQMFSVDHPFRFSSKFNDHDFENDLTNLRTVVLFVIEPSKFNLSE